jgi:hypothetical protein
MIWWSLEAKLVGDNDIKMTSASNMTTIRLTNVTNGVIIPPMINWKVTVIE